jgi:hypothetical protein
MAPTKSDKRTNSKKVNNVNVPSGASESTTELRKASSAATPDDDYEKYKVDESLMARLSEEDQALVDEMQAKELQDFIDDRDDVLRQLPQSVQESFGTIGFAKFGQVKAWPVLVLNPFDVPPQPVRAMWRTMFARVRTAKSRSLATVQVYKRPFSPPSTVAQLLIVFFCFQVEKIGTVGQTNLPRLLVRIEGRSQQYVQFHPPETRQEIRIRRQEWRIARGTEKSRVAQGV